jgi:glucosyl-dolichyl phosphate glucuronosyltransferase
MKITIAICTWNRARLLEKTLQEFCKLEIPKDLLWEIIVVNNNSSDRTDEILDQYLSRLPLVKIFEPEQGLSNARNTAIAHAKGDYILWTDDDVIVDPQWVSAYLDAFNRWPDAAVFGGKVLPWFESTPPEWLSRHLDRLGTYYALRDFGDVEFALPRNQYPFGANMAFRISALRKCSFNPTLGRKGNLLISGEEIPVIEKIRSEYGDAIWVPSSKVQHFLPKNRMTFDYLKRLHYSNGRYEIGPIKNPNPKRCISGYPFWLLRKWATAEISFRLARVFHPTSYEWLEKMIQASSYAGQLSATKEYNRKNL